MDVLRAMRVFRRVVELNGFSAAARDQRLSNAAVSKEIVLLEEHLRTKLLHRTTRRLSPTTEGAAYYERCVRILDEVDDAELSLRDASASPSGTVRLNVPLSFGLLHVSPILPGLLARWPELRIDVSFTDGFVDVTEQNADLVVRIASELPDSATLVVQTLARSRHVVCASPAYLREHGLPKTPSDLREHSCVVYSRRRTPETWTFSRAAGVEDVHVRGRLVADNSIVIRDALIGGAGIGMLPAFYVGDDLRSGRLRAVLTDYEPPPVTIHAVHQRTKHAAKRVRVVVDALRQHFASAEWAHPA